MSAKRTPHLRLKKLRKIIEFTQLKLAEKCGVSYPYLLAVETGQRPMSEKLAQRISFATGAPKEWLLFNTGTDDAPKDFFGKEYNKEAWERYCAWDASKRPGADFGDVGDEVMWSDDEMFKLGAALRAAWRLGKFNVALLMLRDLVHSLERDLKLTAIMKEEWRHDIPKALIDAEYSDKLHYRTGSYRVLPLLSHFARYKWSKAFVEGGQKEKDFIEEIDDLHSMIMDSFELKSTDGKSES